MYRIQLSIEFNARLAEASTCKRKNLFRHRIDIAFRVRPEHA